MSDDPIKRLRELIEATSKATSEMTTLVGPLYYATRQDDATVRDWTVHPGEILSEILRDRGINQIRLAEMTDIAQGQWSLILSGRRPISAATALKLEAALGAPTADFWVRCQGGYDLDIARGRSISPVQDGGPDAQR